MVGNALARRPSRGQAAAITVVIVAVGAIAAGNLLQAGPPEPPSDPSPIAPSLRSAPPPTPAPAPAADWAPLDLAPLPVAASLEPAAGDEAGVPAETTFTLTSLTDEPAGLLAARLEVAPSTEFTVATAEGAATATITPSTRLVTGATYRFALRETDGSLTGSWAFRVRSPVRVISTIPSNAATYVPVRTGIEVTFNQEDVADMGDHFSIEPNVKGTFERHGRTQVFVPTALAPATTYTVTLRKGLARTGTDLAMPADVVFRFETNGPPTEQVRLQFGREVIESAPGEPATISVFLSRPWVGEGQLPAPTRTAVKIYRFASLDQASRALTDYLAAPHWAAFTDPLFPTDELTVVGSFTARLEPLRNEALLLPLPVALDEGWYVLEIPGDRPAQAFLQVTPVSAWVSVMDDRTVAWVNDVVTHRPVEGATVGTGRTTFATSNADGLAIGGTPRNLVPVAAGGDANAVSPVMRVTSPGGSAVLVPFNVRDDGPGYRGEWWETTGSADESYWSLLYTDRTVYRQTDHIDVWGYLRGRDDGVAPSNVELRLTDNRFDGGLDNDQAGGPIDSIVVQPGPDGVFTASFPITKLPLGGYSIQGVVDGKVVASHWLEVSVIRKPAYGLRMTSDHAAVIAGTRVTFTTTATFFEGTPVVGLPLSVTVSDPDRSSALTSDANGSASTAFVLDAPNGYRGYPYTQARPAGPEAADISASISTIVFPSAYDVHAQADLAGDALQISGAIATVDLARVERELAARTWDGDPSGKPVRGAAIAVTITELVPTRRLTGNAYDFLEKVVRPVYEYDYDRRLLDPVSISSGIDGKFSISTQIPNGDHQYEMVLTAHDTAGRAQVTSAFAGPSITTFTGSGVEFLTADDKNGDQVGYDVGDMVAWRMVDDGRDLPTGGEDRYLYVVAQRGLRAAVVTDTPRFRHRFAQADAPGIFVMGVRFTGTTYAPKAASWANFDLETRRINVRISSDKGRYRPGETATLTVRTSLPDGKPVAASVVLQTVDEKLFALGDASVPDALQDLYARVDSGIVRLTATHQLPSLGREGEGGDTTGGGGDGGTVRTDFRDSLPFRELRTDDTGQATTQVRLSDDLTSWHAIAGAVSGNLATGTDDLLLPVGLPVFVELTTADMYQLTDRPVVQVRAFGDALRAGDRIDFTIGSASLGLPVRKITGEAFVPISVRLPTLSLGTHSLTVTARAPARRDEAGTPLRDGLTGTFEVVGSRFTASQTAYSLVNDGLPAVPVGADESWWTFADAGRGQLIPLLLPLADRPGLRLDRALAQRTAIDLLSSDLGRDAASLPPMAFDRDLYNLGTEWDVDGNPVRNGVNLVPSGGVDPWLAARVALLAPDAFDTEEMRGTLRSIVNDPDVSRDLQIAALAGLAAVHEPVLGDLRLASRQPGLAATEKLYLALGFEAMGDDGGALTIERDLLGRYGERLGPWARLRVDRTGDNADPTALLAVIAAGLGDPLASQLAGYASTYPATDAVNALELAAYAARSIERTRATDASFAITVGGDRTVVRLEPGDAYSVRLSTAQVAGLSVETLSGSVLAVVEGRVPVPPASLVPNADLTLARAPITEPIPDNRMVRVDLHVTFAASAPEGCYDVTELVPSGLAPLAMNWRGDATAGITWPSQVVGQQVSFCAFNDRSTGSTVHLRYEARVVNTGTFAWESAIMNFPQAPEYLALTPSRTVSIGQP